jgi:hypothetical protein
MIKRNEEHLTAVFDRLCDAAAVARAVDGERAFEVHRNALYEAKRKISELQSKYFRK